MTHFHEGDEVEVLQQRTSTLDYWERGKIVHHWHPSGEPSIYNVEFQNGWRAVFDAEHIRAIETACIHSASITTADGEGAYCRDCGETLA